MDKRLALFSWIAGSGDQYIYVGPITELESQSGINGFRHFSLIVGEFQGTERESPDENNWLLKSGLNRLIAYDWKYHCYSEVATKV